MDKKPGAGNKSSSPHPFVVTHEISVTTTDNSNCDRHLISASGSWPEKFFEDKAQAI